MALLVMLPHNSLLVDIPLTLFCRSPFIVGLLAFCQRDLGFNQVVFPVQLGAYTGVAFLLGGSEQPSQFFFMEQQLAGAVGLADGVGTGGVKRSDAATQQPGLAGLDQHVAVDQLHFFQAQGFHLPALQGKASLEGVFDEVIVARLLVEDDGVVRNFGFFSHGRGL